MTVKTELQALQRKHKLLQAETVVEWAQSNPKSALHQSLEWDDAKAGAEYRIWQVRRLIAVHIVSEKGVRQMVSLTIDRLKPGGGYRDLDAVMEQPLLREALLKQAWGELQRVKDKYETLQEFAKVWGAIKQVGKTMKKAA